ncbi:hypothetical protein [Actinoplanes aureus]|uniref:Uncharacterized protein n=1 Tax=Actinoplanes aureus TaxID=2792083 RepID=A0A931CI66_9ACTN|nr:hypothetical protein [Actinoplanes aureus]MBG0568457.1 hypothetical protein [Actinoplanes aureus]
MPSLAWWGKLLVFVAGLTAVIDVLDPDRLRARGVSLRKRSVRASRRRRRRNEIHTVLQLRRRLLREFVVSRAYGNVPFYEIVTEPPTESPVAEIESAAFIKFWHEVMAETRANFDLRFRAADDSEVRRARSFAQDRIDALLQTMPLRNAGLLSKASQTENRSWNAFGALIAAAIVLPMLGLTVLAGAHWGRIPVAVFFFLSLFGLTALAITAHQAPGAISSVIWRIAAWPALWSAQLLNRSRPLHPLRRVALVLFVAGSLIDLIT